MKDTRHQPLLGGALAVLGLISFVIPGNYVELTALWDTVAVGGIAAGFTLSIVVLLRAGTTNILRMIVPVAVLAGIAGLVGGDLVSSVFFFAPILIGAGIVASSSTKTLRRLVFGLLIATTLSLLLDAATRSTVVSEWFGTPFRPLVDYSGFRARGIIGQPVPAAMLSVTLGAVAWIQARELPASPSLRIVRLVIVASVVLSLFLTGTRSAFLVAVAVIILMLLRRSNTQRVKTNPLIVVAASGLVAVGLVVLPLVSGDLLASRLLSFDQLAGSESTRGRLFSGEIFSRWVETCDVPCAIAGSGVRSLQSELAGSSGILGLTTVDNLYMTLLWDIGLLGLVILAVVAIASVRVFFSRRSSDTAVAGAIGTLAVLLSGLAYDALYTKPVLLVFGMLIGMMCVRRSAADVPEVIAAQPTRLSRSAF